MSTYKTPGVYVEEISKLPASVAQVATAIPAFIGYTEIAEENGVNLTEPKKISSMLEYETYFGGPFPETDLAVNVAESGAIIISKADDNPTFAMHYCLQMFFANGGGDCYIVSVGQYYQKDKDGKLKLDTTKEPIPFEPLKNDQVTGLNALEKEDDPTLILFPDAQALKEPDFYELYQLALDQCKKLGDRFTIIDVKHDVDELRNKVGSNLMYGAAYYPKLESSLSYYIQDKNVDVSQPEIAVSSLTKLKDSNNQLYNQIKREINDFHMVLPPSSAVAGIYARVDNDRGVWKSPANISMNSVIKPIVRITDKTQEDLNIHTSGKSINAIRAFTGKGTLVWGARTLDGNSNEWRFISVRRFFNMVEESVKKGTGWAVFEPNDANTWVKVKAQIENFLILQWRAGALAGAVPEDAFYVNVGLGTTMTAQDILEGRLIIEIGLATVRPAEFIILRFSHKLQQS